MKRISISARWELRATAALPMVGLLLLILLAGCGQGEAPRLQVGDTAPNFSLPDLSGENFDLGREAGRPVILRFFVPNCRYCRADTAIFNDYFTKYRDQGLRILYINTDRTGADLQTFVRELSIPFPVASDTDGKTAALYRVRVVPQTIVLDPAHRIVGAILGGVSAAELDELLQPYLQSSSASQDNAQNRRNSP